MSIPPHRPRKFSAALIVLGAIGLGVGGCGHPRHGKNSGLCLTGPPLSRGFVEKYSYTELWGGSESRKARKSLFIFLGEDPLCCNWQEIATKSWVSENGRIMAFVSRRPLHFADRGDLEAVFYGSDGEIYCVDFYLRFGDVFKLVRHDNSPTRIKSMIAEESQGRAVVRIKRSTGDRRLVEYAYEFSEDGALNRTLSTFIYDAN